MFISSKFVSAKVKAKKYFLIVLFVFRKKIFLKVYKN